MKSPFPTKHLLPMLCLALSANMSFAQKANDNALEKLSAPFDLQIKQRSDRYYAEQQQKVAYDTIGLFQFRADVSKIKTERKQALIGFIKKNPGNPLSLDALQDVIGHLPDDIRSYEKLFKALKPALKTSEDGKKLRQSIDKFLTVSIGAVAPDFTALDPQGQPISLGDFRGQYVLIDFWASWCVPCREENPHVVAAYKKFKDHNFQILGVSLDQPNAKEAWVAAIAKDGLLWPQVSDLKFWNSDIAKLYTVRSIPQNFLLDPNGVIVAVNLRGDDLTAKLTQLLK